MSEAPGSEPSTRREALLVQLDRIEQEMRRIGFWSQDLSSSEADHVRRATRSFQDAPSFELWLQCVFVPNARDRVQSGELPTNSDVGLMATREYDYHSVVEEARGLVELLTEFDRLVRAANAG